MKSEGYAMYLVKSLAIEEYVLRDKYEEWMIRDVLSKKFGMLNIILVQVSCQTKILFSVC
jgi:hypothetical protein